MKAKALRTVNWACGDNLYKCEVGKEIEISSADIEKAKVSGLFKIVETKKTNKKAE